MLQGGCGQTENAPANGIGEDTRELGLRLLAKSRVPRVKGVKGELRLLKKGGTARIFPSSLYGDGGFLSFYNIIWR